jgi:hypothetical protein
MRYVQVTKSTHSVECNVCQIEKRVRSIFRRDICGHLYFLIFARCGVCSPYYGSSSLRNRSLVWHHVCIGCPHYSAFDALKHLFGFFQFCKKKLPKDVFIFFIACLQCHCCHYFYLSHDMLALLARRFSAFFPQMTGKNGEILEHVGTRSKFACGRKLILVNSLRSITVNRTENPCVAGSIPVLAKLFHNLARKRAKVLASRASVYYVNSSDNSHQKASTGGFLRSLWNRSVAPCLSQARSRLERQSALAPTDMQD